VGIEQGQDYWAVERLTQATADTYKSLGSPAPLTRRSSCEHHRTEGS
jgi:hypothetical protein